MAKETRRTGHWHRGTPRRCACASRPCCAPLRRVVPRHHRKAATSRTQHNDGSSDGEESSSIDIHIDMVGARRRRGRQRWRRLPEEEKMQSPYLALSGPTRAIVVLDPVDLEIYLKVKGALESDDRDLSTAVTQYGKYSAPESGLVKREYTNKLSSVELIFGSLLNSVEATIHVQALGGSLPNGFRGKVTASTTTIDMEVLLLDSENDVVAANANGMIELSRRVVSVELDGKLKVQVVTAASDGKDSKVFTPKKDGRSSATLMVGTCKIEVTVAWSQFKLLPKYMRKGSEIVTFLSYFASDD